MNIIISASNDFVKWLGLDLARMPSEDGKRIGTQSIASTENTLSWQCQALREHSRSQIATVIAVEASSRYSIIFPNLTKMSMHEFEQVLKRRWLKENTMMAIESGAILPSKVADLETQFNNTPMNFNWFKNTDLSVNGHVSDTEQWIRAGSAEHKTDHLGEREAVDLGFHINKMRKKVKISKQNSLHERFVPVARLLDDALYRFAHGLSYDKYSNTDEGHFPNPYILYQKKKLDKLTTHGVAPEKSSSNVIYLNQFKGDR